MKFFQLLNFDFVFCFRCPLLLSQKGASNTLYMVYIYYKNVCKPLIFITFTLSLLLCVTEYNFITQD